MAWMSGSGSPVGSAQGRPVVGLVLLSSTASGRPSRSPSSRLVMKMDTPPERQSKFERPSRSIVTVADVAPAGNEKSPACVVYVGLSHPLTKGLIFTGPPSSHRFSEKF